MLNLSRKVGQSILIGDDLLTIISTREYTFRGFTCPLKYNEPYEFNDGVTIRMSKYWRGGHCTLGIEAPKSIKILRSELVK